MKLTIAIPTIDGREEQYIKLANFICDQAAGKPVEVITLRDNREMSIGDKREKLLHMARGEWITMIDDDDWVADDFVKHILEALESNPDCVGYPMMCTGLDRRTPSTRVANISLKYPEWASNADGYDYVRSPLSEVPIRTSIARQIGYRDMRYAEDHDFSRRLQESGLLKTEVYIPVVLYHYRYVHQPHEIKYGVNPAAQTP